MSWRTGLGLVLLLAAIISGWSAWHLHDRSEPAPEAAERSDYILRDFELVTLDKATGAEAMRMKAPELQRKPDESLAITRPVILVPGETGGWQMTADRGWVDADGNRARLKGNVAGDSRGESQPPTSLRTESLELLPDKQVVRTKDAVTLTQPGIMQTGVGFKANLDTRRYQILSQVKVRYDPPKRR